MHEWFTSSGDLKDGYKEYLKKGSSHLQGKTYNCPILFMHFDLEDLIIWSLKAHKKTGQSLFASIVRNAIITIIKDKASPPLCDNITSTLELSSILTLLFVGSWLFNIQDLHVR